MLVYFDTCSLQRPLDDKIESRVRLEAEGMTTLLSAVEADKIQMIGSPILNLELSENPNWARRTFGLEAAARASVFAEMTVKVVERARTFVAVGMKPRDALHLASAESAEAAYFCTCDDGITAKRKLLTDYKPIIVTPVELIGELQ